MSSFEVLTILQLSLKVILSNSALNICKQFPLTCLKNAMQQALNEENLKNEREKEYDFPCILKNQNLVSQVNKY